MERGISRSNSNGLSKSNAAYYGGSEHDFLPLSASQEEHDSCASTSSVASSAVSRRYQSYPSPKRDDNGIPTMPPLEITTSNNISLHSISYPPYGLPSIEGSPSILHKRDAIGLEAGNVNLPKPPLQVNSKFIVLGWNLTHHTRRNQFLISATGTFGFSLLYGYLQELISVELCHRKLGLFLALAQFTGYTVLSYFFRRLETGVDFRAGSATSGMSFSRRLRRIKNWGRLRSSGNQSSLEQQQQSNTTGKLTVPLELYVGLSILRAIDLGMTNLAMQYVNYPAKTLMKSTRVVFTMMFGIIVTKKRYGAADFGTVGLMVAGLGMFMHADAKTSAVFQPLGIIMLTISLLCDGAISNLSEALMNRYDVGQDEFIFRLYSIATIFICIAAALKGDLRDGIVYLSTPGTLKEMEEGLAPTWSISGKIVTMALFSTTGFLGSSTSAAITKSFGALTMSITSTARKATTIFLSFALFPNECTLEHVSGIFLFIVSLVAKSLRASKRGRQTDVSGTHNHHHGHRYTKLSQKIDNNVVAPAIKIYIGSHDSASKSSMGSPLHFRRKSSGEDAV